jgi:hypothetical protein
MPSLRSSFGIGVHAAPHGWSVSVGGSCDDSTH